MIKDYEIKEKLGEGAYGSVYKVSKKNSKEFFVIKKIPLFGLDSKEKEDVNNEAKILSQIQSNYIVKYYESFVNEDALNIVMEYCDSGDLSEFIESKKKTKKLLKEDLILQIFIKIVIGLAYLHKHNILHRDLKSPNIFLTHGLEIKIGDLGVAKVLSRSGFAKTFIGTPYYLSPEICDEKPYNDKSDVWALGCILYELTTYKHPFEAKSQGALILKIISATPEPIHSYYSKDLSNLIFELLNKNYEKRPSCIDILKKNYIKNMAKKFGLKNELEKYGIKFDKSPAPYIKKITDSNTGKKRRNSNCNKNYQKISISPGSKKKIMGQKSSEKENKINNTAIDGSGYCSRNGVYANVNKSNVNNNVGEEKTKKIRIPGRPLNITPDKIPNRVNYNRYKSNENIISNLANNLNNYNNNNVIFNNQMISPRKFSKGRVSSSNRQNDVIKETDEFDQKHQLKDQQNSPNQKIYQSEYKKFNIHGKEPTDNIRSFAENPKGYTPQYKLGSVRKTNYIEVSPFQEEKKIAQPAKSETVIINNPNRNIKRNSNQKNDFQIIDNNVKNPNDNMNLYEYRDSDIETEKSEWRKKNKKYEGGDEDSDGEEKVKEISENNRKELRNSLMLEKKMLLDKVIKLKNELLKLIGENDYKYIMSLYSSIDSNQNNVDEIYKKIEDFATSKYEKYPEKKEKFNEFYLYLVSADCLAAKKERQLKKILMI